MSGNAFHRWSMRQALSVFLLAILPVPGFANQPGPVWTLNFKDTFLDIACVNEQKAIIVGDRGRLLTTHGKYNNLWAPRDSKTTEMLTAVTFFDDQLGWAAGHGGIIIPTDDGGENWGPIPTGIDNIYNGLHFHDTNNGFLVGEFGTLLRTSDGGHSWQQADLGGYQGSIKTPRRRSATRV